MKRRTLCLWLVVLIVLQTIPLNGVRAEGLKEIENYLVTVNTEQKLQELKKEKKVKKSFKHTHTAVLELNKEEVDKLKQDKDIISIEKNSPVSITSDGKAIKSTEAVKKMRKDKDTLPWGANLVGAGEASDHNIDGKGINVAVLDTGISDHPDLNVKGGVSFVEGTTSFTDDNGHGTHVSGTISAQKNKIGILGVSPKINLYAVKVLDKNGQGDYISVMEGLEWAIENKMNIVSMSFGGTLENEALHNVIKKAASNNILLIGAAGNAGNADEDTLLYPAKYPEVISVGAIGKNLKSASFSSVGKELDITAPGVEILSTTNDGKYGTMSGTSMAAPHVTGAAALLMSTDKKLTTKEIIEKIYRSATPSGDQEQYGHGILNISKALGISNREIEAPFVDQPLPKEDVEPTNMFDLVEYDRTLKGLSDKLYSIYKESIMLDNSERSKDILNKYNELKQISTEIHRLPNSMNHPAKEIGSNEVTAISELLSQKQGEYDKLVGQYEQAISNFSMKKTNTNILGVFDNLGVYEPNNTTAEATPTSPGNNFSSYIETTTDIDYYKFTASSTGTMSIRVTPPSDKDFDVAVLNASGTTVASGTNGTGSVENVSISVTSGSIYYIKIYGYSGANSTVAYSVSLTTITPSSPTLYLNTPIDVDLPAGASQSYVFTPSQSGAYKIFTGPYAGTGAANDTVLEIYSDPSLTSMIASNDDSNGTTFSEVKMNLNAGTKYYVKLRHYNTSTAVHARLNAQVDVPPVETLSLNSPVDINLPAGSSKVYKFTPSSSGNYRINTDFYGGVSSSGSNDTLLYVYTDANLTNQIAYNDDTNGTFSQVNLSLTGGTSYYVKVAGYNNGNIYARLNATLAPPTYTAMSNNTFQDVTINAGQFLYYKFTAPKNGTYRFYTGSYQNNGQLVDTTLRLYSDEYMSNELVYSDDLAESQFSKITYQLTGGATYYVKLGTYSSTINTRFSISPNKDLYIKSVDDEVEDYIGSEFVQFYPEGDFTINIGNSADQLEDHLVKGVQYVVEDGRIFYTRQELSYNMDILQYDDRVVLYVYDDVALAASQPYEVPDSGIMAAANCSSSCDYTVILSAGMTTHSSYFNDAVNMLISDYNNAGKSVKVKTFFPYGKTDGLTKKETISLGAKQLKNIVKDMTGSASNSKGGQALKKFYNDNSGGGKRVLIGHSGGGVASYHAGVSFDAEGKTVHEIVQVGSPKFNLTTLENQLTFVQTAWYNSDPIVANGIGWGIGDKPYNIVNVKQKWQWNSINVHSGYFRKDITFDNTNNLRSTLSAIKGVIQ